jgi:hypothetical protein
MITASKPALNLTKYAPLEEGNWSNDELQKISQRTGFSIDDLRLVLKWNVISVQQMAMLCNVSESRIRNAISPYLTKNGTKKMRLSTVTPFPDCTTDGGKTYIFMDDVARNYILSR